MLSPEVVNSVVDYAATDWEILRALTGVTRVAATRARYHLFQDIQVPSNCIETFFQLLVVSDATLGHVSFV